MTNTTATETPTEILTIVDQLGGRRIFAMAFTRVAYAMRPSPEATFHVARTLVRGTKGKATHVIVTLTPDDLYDVRAVRVAPRSCVAVTVEEVAGVFGDQLRATVESMTGLALSL
jgi:hypothetical protein